MVTPLYLALHLTIPTQAAPVNDELCCPAGAFIVQVQPHHSGPSSATEAESSRTDSVQARHFGLHMLR